MPSPDVLPPADSPADITANPLAPLVEVSKTLRGISPSSSISSLPLRRSNAAISTLFASTSHSPSIKGSSSSGTATPTAGAVIGSVFSNPNAETRPLALNGQDESDIRSLVVRAFVPHVAVYASPHIEELLHDKGLPGGLLQLLRPYGERIQGRVTIRDSVGASKTWEDYGVRFVALRDGLDPPLLEESLSPSSEIMDNGASQEKESYPSNLRTGGDVAQIEELVDRHLVYHAEAATTSEVKDALAKEMGQLPDYAAVEASSDIAGSPFHTLYLRRLLSGIPMVPQETFSQPVACVIAIGASSGNPIEELRSLYNDTVNGERRLPPWVSNEYLRYYVLIHDEDRDEVSRSKTLFEQMKRHFGLHCHLLRIRGERCLPSDDDHRRLQRPEWLSAAEELAEIHDHEESADDLDTPTPLLFESDVSAIRQFVREMVTQSIVPMMERNCATWNDQVVSRRRGLSGRFMSLSKRFTPFSSRNSANHTASPTSNNSNYDAIQGFYRPEAPEAIMRRLADFCFLLRDFRLAQTVYDLLRSDFTNDKAWKYYAGSNEMAAISALMNVQQPLTSKQRVDGVDQLLETACYSYLTRCSAPYNALRTLAIAVELLKIRDQSAADDAARWSMRVLEHRLVGPLGNALFTERIAACFAARKGVGSQEWGLRRRKAAFWAIMATDEWLRLLRPHQAAKCLRQARELYQSDPSRQGLRHELVFERMQNFIENLELTVEKLTSSVSGTFELREEELVGSPSVVEEETIEKIDIRPPRLSMTGAPAFTGEPTGPLTPASPYRTRRDDPFMSEDGFV